MYASNTPVEERCCFDNVHLPVFRVATNLKILIAKLLFF